MVTRAVVRLLLALFVLLLGSSVLPASAQIASSDRTYWPTAEWQMAPPAAQGMDPALLAAADARIRAE